MNYKFHVGMQRTLVPLSRNFIPIHASHQNFVSVKDTNWGNWGSKVNVLKKSF